MTPLNTGAAAVPGGFQVFGSGLPIFYDVTTTAAFSGTITTCYSYPDANQDGVVDGTTLGESGVRLLHEEGTEFVRAEMSDKFGGLLHHLWVIYGTLKHLSAADQPSTGPKPPAP